LWLREKAGKRAKSEDKMDGREECRILQESWREKKKNTENRGDRSTTRGTGMPVKMWKD
jgi:hypothetical protein